MKPDLYFWFGVLLGIWGYVHWRTHGPRPRP